MKRFSKILAALVLMAAVICAAGCNKSDDTNNNGNNDDHSGSLNGHSYVDLGLPSGTMWATCNVGTSIPEGSGDFFAWGETATKDIFYLDTYKYCVYIEGESPEYNTITKYCTKPENGYNGFTDGLTTLVSGDDAATLNWGGGWFTPSSEQWWELIHNTTYTWKTRNGVKGAFFSAKNGNSIFLPATGLQWYDHVDNADMEGDYWASDIDTTNSTVAWCCYIKEGEDQRGVVFSTRVSGLKVRPVCNPK